LLWKESSTADLSHKFFWIILELFAFPIFF
jgi:hypothetical protein